MFEQIKLYISNKWEKLYPLLFSSMICLLLYFFKDNEIIDKCYYKCFDKTFISGNHTIFRHDNFIGCLSADKIKMPVRKYFCFNIPVYRNMAEAPSCRSPYHEEYIQTSVSGSPEGLCHLTYNSLSKRR